MNRFLRKNIPYYWLIENWFDNIKWWFNNQYNFSKQFFYIRTWDFKCLEYFLLVFLKQLHNSMKNGHEV